MKYLSVALIPFLFEAATWAKEVQVRPALAKLKQIAKDDAESSERLLSRAYPLAVKAFTEHPWSSVEAVLKAAALMPVKVRRWGGSTEYRCVVQPGAFAPSHGVKMDLYVGFLVSEGRSQPTYAVPPEHTIWKVSVGLSGTINASQERVRQEEWFEKGSFLQEALSTWPPTDAKESFPWLESVDLSYGDVQDQDTQRARKGFRLQLNLGKGTNPGQVRRRLECSATDAAFRKRKRAAIGGWTSRDFSFPGAAATLAEDLQRILKERDDSYQMLLHKATHLVHAAALDREWPAVARELEGQPLKLVSDRSWQYGRTFGYQVAEKAFTTPSGQGLDLFVQFSTKRETSNAEPTKEIVGLAYAGLSAEVQASYSQVMRENWFGEHTAIHLALLHEEVAKAAKDCPILKSVKVNYDVMAYHREVWHAWGFCVTADLIVGKQDESQGTVLKMYLSSELDPLQSDGSIRLVRGFVPKNSLGAPWCSGGSSYARRSPPGEPTSFLLTKKGASPWRKNRDEPAKPVVAYGVGDLRSLPADTPSIKFESQEVYDDDLALFTRFRELRYLDLGAGEGVTDAGLAHLSGLRKLASLTLSGKCLVGTGFSHLARLPALTDLTIYSSKTIDDSGFAVLAEMKQLRSLGLCWATELTDDQLAKLAGLKALKTLDIWGSGEITDAGLTHISKLDNLEELRFSNARGVTSQGIAQLTSLKHLREISMGYLPATKDAVAPLSRIASLEYLSISGIATSGKEIQAIAKLPHLKRLSMHDCKGASSEDVNRLKAGLSGEYILEIH